MQKRPKRSTVILLAVAAVVVIGVGVGGVLLKQNWNKPLGEGLGMPTLAPTETLIIPTAAPTSEIDSLALGGTPEATVTAEPTLTPTPEPLCGGPATMMLLGIGADNRSDNYLYGLSDVMRIARVDFVTPKVTMLSIPRDLWVEIPDIADHYGIDHGKLNQAYLYGGPGMGYYDGPGGGPGLLARTLDLNFGLRVEHYGAVNMQTFVKIIDAVGGIDVYLERDVDGRPVDEKTDDMGYFTAGQHHLSGAEALRLSRIRKKYSDLARGDNQTLVLCALKEKVTSAAVLPKIPQIIAAFEGSVQTDLTPAQISQLACLVPKLSRENLIFTSLPKDILKPGTVYDPYMKDNTFVFDVDFDEIRSYVDQFVAGAWPTQPEEPSCP
ncbi:MAG TPA: LCP family protein [Anaerolineaceae bacterium]|nr:LCP family protein [Anaerolineaceae bacterium]